MVVGELGDVDRRAVRGDVELLADQRGTRGRRDRERERGAAIERETHVDGQLAAHRGGSRLALDRPHPANLVG